MREGPGGADTTRPGPREELRERRAERRAAERRRRRRLGIAALAVALGGVAAGVALSVHSSGGGSTPPEAARAAATTGRAATTPAAADGTAPAPAATTAGATGPAAQAAAVERYAAMGVPIFRGGGAGKYVALTFDDGPGPYTQDALRTLRRDGAHATFFVVGRNVAPWRSEIPRELSIAAVGDHSWSHTELTRLDAAGVRQELASTQRAAAEAGGEPVRLFRPPYGARNADVDRIGRELGMLQVLWDIDSLDSQGATWDRMLADLKREVHPGAIILLHENRGQTMKTVHRLVPWLRRQGYTMVSVPELLVLDPPSEEQVRSDARRWAGLRMTEAPAG